MNERCLDCGQLRGDPGVPGICAAWHTSSQLTTHSPAPESADSRFERQLAHSQELEATLRKRNERIKELEKQVTHETGSASREIDSLQRRIKDLEYAQSLRATRLRQATAEVWLLQQEVRQHAETKRELLLENASTDDLLAELRRRIDNKEN